MTNALNLTLKDYWKDNFNILHCVRIIDKTLEEISLRIQNFAWRELCPDCVDRRFSESFELEFVVDEFVHMVT